ncbi:hypothetical protein [Nocardioides sp. AX2bis]|uniref:hypothetical protein n=1 Tax=Nocardioides sp. AX2bis TaxID=2653157 RepID=UPI001356E78E|nr:hypothetical protein [Nocardioides sp. AX2bis]
MRGRVVGVVFLLALVGLGGGWLLAGLDAGPDAAAGPASPLPASSPSVPVRTEAPYAVDGGPPALAVDLEYRKGRLGTPPFGWTYEAPAGWVATDIGAGETKLVPPDAVDNGYGMRVKLVSERVAPAQMVAQKLAAFESGYPDVAVRGSSPDTLAVSYRALPENWLRFNTFRWFTRPGSTEAVVEVSVFGRERDLPGLDDLLDQVAASLQPVG